MCDSREAAEQPWEMEGKGHLTSITSNPGNMAAAALTSNTELTIKTLPSACSLSIPLPVSSFLPLSLEK